MTAADAIHLLMTLTGAGLAFGLFWSLASRN